MHEALPNALAEVSSAYLRSAQHQPVQWQPWGAEAFAEAVAKGKPVLLDIGATWCHWCPVMSRESYGDAQTAALINELFVPIKVDRDERPDVDARYQAAVAAISGRGGWPLTALLTPDGRPFFGGTYFPAEERYGQPGFQRVLRTMAHAFYEQRHEVEETAGSVMEAIEQSETFAGPPVSLRETSAVTALLDRLTGAILQQSDPVNGGFGAQPKFPHAPALDLLLHVGNGSGPQADAARSAALVTLHRMARGGIFDQLAGGFHRYAVDARWAVPRFEKMLYDNAALLLTYTHAARITGDADCTSTARALLSWMDAHLTDRERGGFYASQAADASSGDNGRYYTWSLDEAAAVLTPEEFAFARPYFGLGPVGEMPSDPTRNVLTRQQGPDSLTLPEGLAAEVTEKLLAARSQRTAPPIDRAMYTGWNGMCISAYVHAGRVLQQPDAVHFARLSLDRVLTTVFQDGAVGHVIAGFDGRTPNPVPAGGLDDHVLLAQACMDVWEATGEASYARAAEQIAAALLLHFHDEENGGFFDMPRTGDALGALTARRKPMQDAFVPAGNAGAAMLLLRLHALTGAETYRARALETLECFAGVIEQVGLYAAGFGLALRRLAQAG